MCTNLAIDWGPHIVRMGYKTMYIYVYLGKLTIIITIIIIIDHY